MHMELRNAVMKPLGINISVGDFLQRTTAAALTDLVFEKLVAKDLLDMSNADAMPIDDMEEFIL